MERKRLWTGLKGHWSGRRVRARRNIVAWIEKDDGRPPLRTVVREGSSMIIGVGARRGGSGTLTHRTSATNQESKASHGYTAGHGSASIRIAISDCCCQLTGISVVLASSSTRPFPRRWPQRSQRRDFCRSSRAVTSMPPNRANSGVDLHWGLPRLSHKAHQSTRIE